MFFKMSPQHTLKAFHSNTFLCGNVKPIPRLTKAFLQYFKCNM